MALVKLICPHCGGPFHLDDKKSLQPRWQCPYCNRRSLIDRDGSSVRLRGILSQDSSKDNSNPPPDWTETDDDNDPADASWPANLAAAPADLPPASPQEGAQDELTNVAESAPDVASQKSEQAPPDMPESEPDAPDTQTDPQPSRLDQMIEAARQNDLPRFNSLSRKLLDEDPTQGKVYAWRAILTEKADGFSSHIWGQPGWLQRLPRHRQQQVAQHFYALSTALRFARLPVDRQALLEEIAGEIALQIQSYFQEYAIQRLPPRRRNRPFRGKYRRRDLMAGPALVDALQHLADAIESPSGLEMHRLVLLQLEEQDAALKRKLERYFSL